MTKKGYRGYNSQADKMNFVSYMMACHGIKPIDLKSASGAVDK